MRFVHGSFVLVIAMAALSLAAACGGSTPPADTGGPGPQPSAGTPEEPKPAEAKPEENQPGEAKPEAPKAKPAWKEMKKEEQVEFMKTVVAPKMAALFKEHDAKKFAEVECTTCHGEGAKEGKFEMPNPKLPQLDRTNRFAKHKKKDAKMLKFMMEKVVPEMAAVLGEKPFDPATQQGFGCGECHVITGK